MRIRLIGSLVLCIVALTTQVWSQDGLSQDVSTPSMRASASKTNVLIAEAFTVRVEVLAPAGSEVDFPEVIGEDETKLGEFDVLASQKLDDIPLDDPSAQSRRWTRTLTLETLRLGKQSIPSMNAIVTQNGEPRTLTSEPIEITVSGVLESEDSPLRDISGVIEPEPQSSSSNQSDSAWWIVGCIAVVVILASVVGFRWWRKRQRPLRWCQQELIQLDEELQTLCEALYPINLVNWTQRLRSVLQTAVGAHQSTGTRLSSTKQLLAEIDSIDETPSMTACEHLLRELDRVRFSTEAVGLQSESAFTTATDAIKEAEALLKHFTALSRANRRGR